MKLAQKLLFVVVIITQLLSCNRLQNKDNVIGFSQCVGDNEWRTAMYNEMKIELSFYPDVELIYKNADGSSEKQIEQIEELIEAGVDVIIVSPNESKPLTDVCVKAYEAGIHTIILDRTIETDKYTCFIGASNKEIGEIAGEYAAKICNKKAKILEVWGLPGSSPAHGRHEGFHKSIEKYEKMKVVEEIEADWNAETVTEILQKTDTLPEVDLVYSHNDEMALSVYNFMKKSKLDVDTIKFLGIDALMGENGGIRAVIDGKLEASFLYPSGGDKAIQTAVKLLEGKKVRKNIRLNTAIINHTNAKTLELQSNQMLNYQEKITKQQKNLKVISEKYNTQKTFLTIIIGLLVVMVALVVMVFFAYRTTNRVNKELNIKNIQIEKQTKELASQRDNLIAMNEKVEEQNKEILATYNNLKTLSEFGKQITSMLDFESLNKLIFKYLQSFADVSSFGIGIFNEKHNTIDYIAFIDNGKRMPAISKTLDRKNSLSRWTWRNQTTLHINDMENEYHKYTESYPDISTEKKPQSVVQVPLTVEKNKIGLLVANSYTKDAFSEKEVTNIEAVATYLAIAIDNTNAYRTIENKNKNILESIYYAETIQKAILPPKKLIRNHFNSFILYLPRDIVSGDFYWFAHQTDDKGNEYKFLAAVDCTGHGVPGAFMSMIGANILNQIVNERKIFDPGVILKVLNKRIFDALNQGKSKNDDGMDVCLCRFAKKVNDTQEVTFAGAKRPLILLYPEAENVEYIKGSIASIGGKWFEDAEYKTHELTLKTGTKLFLTSDGLFDQNNRQRQRYSNTHFKNLVYENRNLSMEDMLQIIEIDWLTFKKRENQIDDVMLIGIEI